jgi:hypothetical protein
LVRFFGPRIDEVGVARWRKTGISEATGNCLQGKKLAPFSWERWEPAEAAQIDL